MSTLLLMLLVILYSLTCLFVILTILLQSGKGGGLSSLGSGAGGALSDSLGATGAEKTLIKATSWASGIFLVLSLALTLYGSRLQQTGGLPALPAPPAPATGTAPPATEGQPVEGVPAATGQPAEAPAGTATEAPVTIEVRNQPAESAPATEGTEEPVVEEPEVEEPVSPAPGEAPSQ